METNTYTNPLIIQRADPYIYKHTRRLLLFYSFCTVL